MVGVPNLATTRKSGREHAALPPNDRRQACGPGQPPTGIERPATGDLRCGLVVDAHQVVLEFVAALPLAADQRRARDGLQRTILERDAADDRLIVGVADGVAKSSRASPDPWRAAAPHTPPRPLTKKAGGLSKRTNKISHIVRKSSAALVRHV